MEKQLIPQLRFSAFKDEWKIKKVENILTIGSGKDYKHLKDGEIPVYGTGGYMTSVNEFLYEGESVCIGRKGTIDNPIFLNEKFWTVDTLFYTHSFKQVLPRFVYSLFQNINWYKHNEASGVPSLSKKTIEKININLPSLPEQQKIASFLTDVDDKITKITKKKELLEQYKKGVMQKIFSQELRFRDEEGKKFPDWKLKKLGQVATKQSSNISANTIEDNVGDYKIYGASGLLKKIDFYKENEPYISIVKDGAGVGRTLLCDAYSSVLGTLDIIKPKKGVNLYFLYCLLNNLNFLKFITGSTIPHIYFKDYSTVKIKIPSLEEQTKIAKFLSDIDLKIEALNTKIENSKTFKKGLLQKMFV